MPSLKELQLCLYLYDLVDLANIYSIPWHQLRVFTLRGSLWPSQILLDILQRSKSLVECSLLVQLENGQHEHAIVLPNLESLVLDMDIMNTEASAEPIILSLTVPNLRPWSRYTKLSLSPKAIVITAQRSGFKRLTNFSLRQTKQTVNVRSLLGIMPALKSVTLREQLMFQPGTFDNLTSDANWNKYTLAS